MSNPRDLIEQAARRSANEGGREQRFHVTDNEAATSIAISLKRIADALEAGVIDAQKRGH
jgi:hypothetical protein